MGLYPWRHLVRHHERDGSVHAHGHVRHRGAGARFDPQAMSGRIERAKAEGTKFGRTSVLDASQRRKIAERYAAGETMAELARDYGCGEATIWRALQDRPSSGKPGPKRRVKR